MYIHPSHPLFAVLVSAVQGLFSFNPPVAGHETWALKCEELLVEANKQDGFRLHITSRSDFALSIAVKRSLIEMIDLKQKILTEFPPEDYEYIFFGTNPAVLAGLFELDSRTKEQSFKLPFSVVGYGYSIREDEAAKIFNEMLKFLEYSHDRAKKIVVIAHTSDYGFEVHLLSDLLSQLDEAHWRDATIALLGQRYPLDRRGKPIELYHKHSVLKISAALDALTFNDYFRVLEPMYRTNLSNWKAIFSGETPFLLPAPVYQRFLEITRQAFPEGH